MLKIVQPVRVLRFLLKIFTLGTNLMTSLTIIVTRPGKVKVRTLYLAPFKACLAIHPRWERLGLAIRPL
jgi:hypothetical protein